MPNISSSPGVKPSGRLIPAAAASSSTTDATAPWARIATTPATTTAAYWRNATAPTPNTLPARSWNGVAALRTTSITREDFSSTTLIAIQLPYMMMIMKIRIVMPKASMSWPTAAATVSWIGSVRSGSGHWTSNSAGANRVAWPAGATPRRSRRSPIAIAFAPCWRRPAVLPVAGSLVYSVNSSSSPAARSIPSTAE